MLDLKAKPDRPAESTVIEAKLDRGRGPVATGLLIQRGTLHGSDIVVPAPKWPRPRAESGDLGERSRKLAHHRSQSRCWASITAPEDRAEPVCRGRERGPRPGDHRLTRMPARRKRLAVPPVQRGSLEQMMTQLKVAGTKNSRCWSGRRTGLGGGHRRRTSTKWATDEVRARIFILASAGLQIRRWPCRDIRCGYPRLQRARQRSGPPSCRTRWRRDHFMRRDLRFGGRG